MTRGDGVRAVTERDEGLGEVVGRINQEKQFPRRDLNAAEFERFTGLGRNRSHPFAGLRGRSMPSRRSKSL